MDHRWLLVGMIAGAVLTGRALADDAFRPELADALTDALGAWHASGQFEGTALVHRHGQTWVGAVGMAVPAWDVPNTPDTKFPIASLTKQLTAVLTMQEVERGRLSLDDAVSDHLPAYRQDTGQRMTIEDLLSHTAGLPDPGARYFFEVDIDTVDTAWIIERHLSADLMFEPGTSFFYGNSEYMLLGAILEALDGQAFADVVDDRITAPLGMSNTGLADRDAVIPRLAIDTTGADDRIQHTSPYRWENWLAAGGLYSTVWDLHAWNRALTGGELLGTSTFERMLTPRTDVGDRGNYVALGSWVYPRTLPGSDRSITVIERRGGIGGFASLNAVVKDDDTWVVLLANRYTETIHQLPWGASLPLDLLLIAYGLSPEGPPNSG